MTVMCYPRKNKVYLFYFTLFIYYNYTRLHKVLLIFNAMLIKIIIGQSIRLRQIILIYSRLVNKKEEKNVNDCYFCFVPRL